MPMANCWIAGDRPIFSTNSRATSSICVPPGRTTNSGRQTTSTTPPRAALRFESGKSRLLGSAVVDHRRDAELHLRQPPVTAVVARDEFIVRAGLQHIAILDHV